MITHGRATARAIGAPPPHRRAKNAVVRFIRTKPLGFICALILLFYMLVAIFGPMVYDGLTGEDPLVLQPTALSDRGAASIVELAPAGTLARLLPGDRTPIRPEGDSMIVENIAGIRLGKLEQELSGKLGHSKGKTFYGTVVSVGPDRLVVQITEATDARFLGPFSGGSVLGTDHLGRDIGSRLIHGAWISLFVAVTATALGETVGALVGITSGYIGGWLDAVFQRIVDSFLALPTLILAIAVVAVFGQDIWWVIGAIAISFWPRGARVIRSVTLQVKQEQYVEAARALGAGSWRIMLRHIAPQAVAPFIILATAALGGAVLAEASLSFLGLGVPPPKPSWGSMLTGPAIANVQKAPWNAIFPGLALTMVVFAFNIFGDTLRDILDPRLRR